MHAHNISVVGWLPTAMAMTLGAPFWFDMLKPVHSGALKYQATRKEPSREVEGWPKEITICPLGNPKGVVPGQARTFDLLIVCQRIVAGH